MALTPAELRNFREHITQASRPLVFYDDDADGVCSYLLVKHANRDARGVRAARGPELDSFFVRKVEEHQPDLVVVLDKPLISDEFLAAVKTPIVWLDHHPVQTVKRRDLTYYHPSLHNRRDTRPTSYWVWRALGGPLWIAAAGVTSDWYDTLLGRFAASYPALVPKRLTVEEALFKSPLGELIRCINFLLKGSTGEIAKRVAALTRVEDPREILEQTTATGNWLWKQHLPRREEYGERLEEALGSRVEKGVFAHIYPANQTSFVADVSNELMVRKPQAKVILVGRESGAEIKFSLRSYKKDTARLIQKALRGVDGYGGGHRAASGGAVKRRDWERFLAQLRKAV